MLNWISPALLGWIALNAWAAPPPVRVIQVYPKADEGSASGNSRSHVNVVPAPPPAAPTQAPVPTSGAPAVGDNPDAVEQVARERQNYEQAHAGFNSLNPLSSEFQAPNPGQVPAELMQSPELKQRMEQLQALLGNPAVQGYLKIASDKEVQDGAMGVLHSPDLKKLGLYQLGFLVVFMFARSMWMGRATSLIKRVWVSFSSGIIYLGCASVGLPLLVLGSNYMKILQGVWRVVQKQL